MAAEEYLLAGQASELERLQLQSRVWEPSGQRLLEAIGPGRGRGLDVGCGVLGWLRLLSRWVGADGEVVGTDIDDAMLAAAAQFVTDEQLPNVTLIKDDLFATSLEPASFDLVHARFELTPLGRVEEQLATYLRLTRHGGVVALEDPDWGSWHFNPPAPALEALITFVCEAFHRWGDADGRTQTSAVVPTLRHRGERPGRGPSTSPGASVPATSTAVHDSPRTTTALLRRRDGAGTAAHPGRSGTTRARTVGHHIHVAPVLGPYA